MKHPFAYRDFRFFWAARVCAMLGHSALILSLGWAVYDSARLSMSVREASLRLGLIGLVQFAPMLLLSPVSGLVADSFDRRVVVRLTLLAQLACAAVLMGMSQAGGVSLILLYLVAALFAAARAFYLPAMNALAPNLVPVEVLPRAIALNAIAGRVGGIVGPVLGGYAYALSPAAAYAVTSLLLGAAFFCQLGIAVQGGQRQLLKGAPLVLMREGLHYVLGNRLLLGAISLDLFAVLLGGVTALLPIYARDVLHIGPDGLGHLRAASSVGALATALLMSWRPIEQDVGPKMLVSVAIFGAATIAFGLSTSMPLSLACLMLLGAADMISVYVRQSMIQMATPDDKRGRVGAISTLFISASNELGELESGLLAAALGPVGAVVAGGVCSILIAGAWARLFPELRAARRFEQIEATTHPA